MNSEKWASARITTPIRLPLPWQRLALQMVAAMAVAISCWSEPGGVIRSQAAPLPQTVVTVTPPVAVGDVFADPVTFTVTYQGGTDGALVVIQWGDGTIGQGFSSNFQIELSHKYLKVGAYAVDVEVFTSGCQVACTADALAIVLPRGPDTTGS